jgi:hypothetical protein
VWPREGVYRPLFRRALSRRAYGRIDRKAGAMPPRGMGETVGASEAGGRAEEQWQTVSAGVAHVGRYAGGGGASAPAGGVLRAAKTLLTPARPRATRCLGVEGVALAAEHQQERCGQCCMNGAVRLQVSQDGSVARCRPSMRQAKAVHR